MPRAGPVLGVLIARVGLAMWTVAAGAGSPGAAVDRPQRGVNEPPAGSLVVPAVARARGAEGTNWVSDVAVLNLGEGPAQVRLRLLEEVGSGAPAAAWTTVLGAGESLVVADVVATAFARDVASGALLIDADQPLATTSRTFNTTAAGTYGQLIPGVPVASLAAGETPLVLPMITENQHARTNFGCANGSDVAAVVSLALFQADGMALGNLSYDLPPLGHLQDNRVLRRVGAGAVEDAYAVVTITPATARVAAYLSVVDNATGDPVFITPSSPSTTPLYVPAAAHVPGLNGTSWRTDLELVNPGDQTATCRVELLRTGAANLAPAAVEVGLAPHAARRIVDTVHALFGASGTGALRVVPVAGAVVAASRTLTALGDGTFGQFVPAIPVGGAVRGGVPAALQLIANSSDPTVGFRTNLGIANATGGELTAQLELRDLAGNPIAASELSVLPFGHRQESLRTLLTSADVAEGLVLVRSAAADAAFFPYASVVDNRTGDPVLVGPATVATAGQPDGDYQPCGVISDEWPEVAAWPIDGNRDGLVDVLALTGRTGSPTVRVYENQGDGSFVVRFEAALEGDQASEAVVADLDGDEWPDFAVALASGEDPVAGLAMFENLGDGGFRQHLAGSALADPLEITARDVNGDGRPDVIVPDGDVGYSILVNRGGFVFAERRVATVCEYFCFGDFDGDGRIDGVCADVTDISIIDDVYGAAADGPRLVLASGAVRTVRARDLDGDGVDEILAAIVVPDGPPGLDGRLDVVALAGDELVTRWSSPVLPGFPFGVQVCDLDSDGALDLVLALGGGQAFLATAGGYVFDQTVVAGALSDRFVCADMDADRDTDLVTGCRCPLEVICRQD